MLWNSDAYAMALAPWLPEVKSFLSDWKPDLASHRRAAESPGILEGFREVKVDPFEKKPVPGAIFREIEEERDRLSEMVIEGAHIAATGDEKAQADLVRRIDERIGQLKTEPAKKAYRALRARLVDGQ